MNSFMITVIVWQRNIGGSAPTPLPTAIAAAGSREILDNVKRRRLNDEPLVEAAESDKQIELYGNNFNGLDLIKHLYKEDMDEEMDELMEAMKNLTLS